MVRLTAVAAMAIAIPACGGKTNPDDDGGTPSGSSTNAPPGESSSAGAPGAVSGSASGSPTTSSGSRPVVDAGVANPGQGNGLPSPNLDAAPPTGSAVRPSSGPCSIGGGGGGSGGSNGMPTCETTAQGVCGGTPYQVSCTCPQARCACFGPTTTEVPFTGCPGCPGLSQAFAICGFPH